MANHWMGVGEALGAAAAYANRRVSGHHARTSGADSSESTPFGLETDVVDRAVLASAVRLFAERGIVLPTFSELEEPASISPPLRAAVAAISADAPHPLNLFRINWFNDGSWP
jgi:hypothetical protein